MPGPVRYTKSGKVKKSAPRKYESGKGWSKLTAKEQAAPAVPQASPPAPSKAGRRSSIRKAAGPIGPVGISPRRQRREAITREIAEQQDTRKTNQEALGFVGDALAKVAEVVTAEPKTDFEKGIAPLTALIPSVGMLKGATVKGVSGLKSAVPARKAAKKAVARREAKAKKAADRPNRRAEARAERRDRGRGYNQRMRDLNRQEEGEVMDPPWVGKSELRGRIDEMKSFRKRR
jgi:hypothetical protein